MKCGLWAYQFPRTAPKGLAIDLNAEFNLRIQLTGWCHRGHLLGVPRQGSVSTVPNIKLFVLQLITFLCFQGYFVALFPPPCDQTWNSLQSVEIAVPILKWYGVLYIKIRFQATVFAWAANFSVQSRARAMQQAASLLCFSCWARKYARLARSAAGPRGFSNFGVYISDLQDEVWIVGSCVFVTIPFRVSNDTRFAHHEVTA